jgi:hypothetical protein
MKPAKWIRDDLQKKYSKLTDQQQPLLREHRELCGKIKKDKAANGSIDPGDLKRLRDGNIKLADLEKQKQQLWKENLDSFRSLIKNKTT